MSSLSDTQKLVIAIQDGAKEIRKALTEGIDPRRIKGNLALIFSASHEIWKIEEKKNFTAEIIAWGKKHRI